MSSFRTIFALFFLFLSGSISAQVILPPDLQCVVNDNVNGNITLYWTVPNNTCGSFNNYTVFAAQNINGPYTSIATVTTQSQNSFVHVNALATGNTWYYYLLSDFNCPGFTAVSSDTVSNLNPATPQIVNVDVTTSGTVNFNWLPSASSQTFGYVIYYFLPNGNAVPLDTVFGINNTSYTDIIGDPTSQSLVYTVSAFDSCWKFSAFNTLPHNTILANAGSKACENEVVLAWNRYINWPQGVKEYQIWVSKNGGAFQLGGVADTTSLSYSYSDFEDGDSLCIRVRAVSAADTNIVSNSNMMCLRTSVVRAPDYHLITNATVGLDNHISLTWTIDTLAELIFYKVDRSVNNVSFATAEQITAPVPLKHFETYTDSAVSPQLNPYYYKITAFDSCQNQHITPYVKTISLQGELFDYYLADIVWNDFELQYATVLRYNIYRNFGSGYQLINTVLPGVNEYADTLRQFLDEKGVFCYRVEAVYDLNLPNGYTAALSSFSNELCIIHRPIIYVPNAFAPYGLNNIFKPTIIYGEPQAYSMVIFNRYGGKVFETTNPDTGWDGSDRGKEAQQGGYAYIIQFTAADGVRVERKGIVLLVK